MRVKALRDAQKKELFAALREGRTPKGIRVYFVWSHQKAWNAINRMATR